MPFKWHNIINSMIMRTKVIANCWPKYRKNKFAEFEWTTRSDDIQCIEQRKDIIQFNQNSQYWPNKKQHMKRTSSVFQSRKIAYKPQIEPRFRSYKMRNSSERSPPYCQLRCWFLYDFYQTKPIKHSIHSVIHVRATLDFGVYVIYELTHCGAERVCIHNDRPQIA